MHTVIRQKGPCRGRSQKPRVPSEPRGAAWWEDEATPCGMMPKSRCGCGRNLSVLRCGHLRSDASCELTRGRPFTMVDTTIRSCQISESMPGQACEQLAEPGERPWVQRAGLSGSASASGPLPRTEERGPRRKRAVSRGMGTWDGRKCLCDAQEEHGTIQEFLWGVLGGFFFLRSTKKREKKIKRVQSQRVSFCTERRPPSAQSRTGIWRQEMG